MNSNHSEAESLLIRAIQCAREKRYAEAIDTARRAAVLAPDWLDAHGHLAWFLVQRGFYVEALMHYRRCLELDPGNADACTLGVRLSLEIFDDQSALWFFNQWNSTRAPLPDNLSVAIEKANRRMRITRGLLVNRLVRVLLQGIGSLLRILRLHRLALSIVELAGATQDHSSAFLYLIGRLRLEQPHLPPEEKCRSALPLFRQITQIYPSASAHLELAKIFSLLDDAEGALLEARRAVTLSPDNVEAQQCLTLAAIRQGEWDEATGAYAALMQRQPASIMHRLHLGLIHQMQRDFPRAHALYEAALTLAPDHPLARFLWHTLKWEKDHPGGPLHPGEDRFLSPHEIVYGQGCFTPPRRIDRGLRVLQTLRHRIAGTLPQLLLRQPYRDTSCAVCGSHRRTTAAFCTGNGWRIVRCRECGLLYTHPQPTPELLQRKYQGEYWEVERHGGIDAFHQQAHHEPIVQPLDQRLFAWLDQSGFAAWENHPDPPRRLLDVGCGLGVFLREMQNRGWTVAGTEISAYAARYCRNQGFDVFQVALDEGHFPSACFDLVTLHHVIEHVPDPLALLRETARILRPGGRLLLRTPHADSLPAVLAGKNWFYDPDHIFFFHRTTLLRLLEQAGFTPLNSMTYVGVQHETWQEAWVGLGLNDWVERKVEEYHQGDVICVEAALMDQSDH